MRELSISANHEKESATSTETQLEKYARVIRETLGQHPGCQISIKTIKNGIPEFKRPNKCRRLYDVLNVMAGLAIIRKIGKKHIMLI